MARRPLAGVRVIDLSHLIAGPFCTMLMADNGADVIKVEPPPGDISRLRAPIKTAGAGRDVSGYFLAMNRGKRSVALNLKTEGGRTVLGELIDTADVVIENFRPGVLARLGVDLDQLARRHPAKVFASLTAYGTKGVEPADRDRPGVAIVAEAVSGLTLLARDREGSPTWAGFPLGDLVSGLTAYGAVLTALWGREQTGEGRRLDLAMSESMLAFNGISLANFAITGRERREAVEPLAVPFGVFPARNGHVVIGVNSDTFWRQLCMAMGRPELADDQRFASHTERAARASEVEELVVQWTAPQDKEELVDAMHAAGVPCSVVADVRDILSNPAFQRRGQLWPVHDGVGGSAVLPGNAMGMADTAAGPVPRLGEHTLEVASELGIESGRLRILLEEGALLAE